MESRSRRSGDRNGDRAGAFEFMAPNTSASTEDVIRPTDKATRDGEAKTKRRDPTFTPRRRVGPHR